MKDNLSKILRKVSEGLLGIELDDKLLFELEVDIVSCRKSNYLCKCVLSIILKPLRSYNGRKVLNESLDLNAFLACFLVKAGDVIAVKETSKESVKIKALIEGLATATTPKWLENDAQNAATKVVALPARDDIDFEFEEQLIVELYSK